MFAGMAGKKAGDHADFIPKRVVIPAKAGIHRQSEAWIPASAAMTTRSEITLAKTSAFLPE